LFYLSSFCVILLQNEKMTISGRSPCQIFQLLIFATPADFSTVAGVGFYLTFRQPATLIIEQQDKCNQQTK